MKIRIAKPDNYANCSKTGPWHLDVVATDERGMCYQAGVLVKDPRQPDTDQNIGVIGRDQTLVPEESIKKAVRQYLKAWGDGTLPDGEFSTTIDES